jgi:hypothetical protein
MSNRYNDFNAVFKDKNKLTTRSNTRYNDRNLLDIELKKGMNNQNVNRFDIERDEFMKSSYEDNNNDNNQNTNDNESNDENANIGRITRNNFDRGFDRKLDRGMPFRSEVNIRKNLHNQNIHPDYILRNNTPTRSTKAFDPFDSQVNNTTGGFADVMADTKISSGTKVESLCTDNINNLSVFFVKNLVKIVGTPFVISTVDIYNIFAALYISSKGNTEIELKNYFEFPRRDLFVEGYANILADLQNNSEQIKNGSCILFNSDLSINPEMCSHFSKLSKVRKINKSNISEEVSNINQIISKLVVNPDMKKSVSSSCIADLNVLLLTYAYLNPTLLLNNIQMQIGRFESVFVGNVNVKYLIASEQIFGYTESDSMKILEICCDNSLVMFGIILLKGEGVNFDRNELNNAIKKIKPVLFNQIRFPLFNIKTKLKLRNVFKKTDLQTIFLDLNCPELFQDNTKIDDVLHNCEIKIDGKTKKVKSSTQYKSDKSFIVDRSFIFYTRLRKSSTLFSIGYF